MIKAWYVCLDIIRDRGFSIDNKYFQLTKTDLNHLLNEDKLDILSNNKDGKVLYLHFINTPKVKYSQITNTIKYCEELNDNFDIMFILKPKPNCGIRKLEFKGENNVQIFWCKQIQFNITKHSLVPLHKKITDEEKENILLKYKILYKSQLPIISHQDPIVRWYNFKKGDIIRISRKSCKNYAHIFNVVDESCLSAKEENLEKYIGQYKEINKHTTISNRRETLKRFYESNIADNLLRYRYVK